MSHPVLNALGLQATESGSYLGNDEWSKTTDAGVLEPVNPSDGSVLARVQASSQADYDTIVERAQQAFKVWRTTPAPRRGEAIRLCSEALRTHKDALGSLVALEMGKSKPEGDGEVQEMIDIGEFSVGLSRQLYGLTMHSERPEHRMYEQWHPLGVVGIISAFNFPVAVWSWNAFLAAICGNVSVWKPSPKTALCAVAVQHLCNRVLERHGMPGIFQLFIDGGTELATRFVDDRRVDLVSFTGSTAVGREVAQRVAKRLGRCLLELGGNNAIIVDEFANLDLAVPAIVFGAVGTAGQRCTSTRRVLVHRSRLAELEKRLTAAYGQVPIGDPLAQGTLMGPLIDRNAVKRYESAIATATSTGGRLVCGGHALDQPGNYVQPTIVVARADMDIVRTETFAPILYLLPFDDLDEAIRLQNDVDHGLSSSIFTDRLQHAERFLSASGSDCGIANVNIGTSGAEIGGAFGGEKDTGGGRESGSDSWKAYMRRQTCTINWGSQLPLAQGINFDVSA